jgi:hypothetical protein
MELLFSNGPIRCAREPLFEQIFCDLLLALVFNSEHKQLIGGSDNLALSDHLGSDFELPAPRTLGPVSTQKNRPQKERI